MDFTDYNSQISEAHLNFIKANRDFLQNRESVFDTAQDVLHRRCKHNYLIDVLKDGSSHWCCMKCKYRFNRAATEC